MVIRNAFAAITFIVVCLTSSPPAKTGSQSYLESNRKKTIINSDWKYISGEATGSPQQVSYDDSKWQKVNVPHCFSIPWFVKDHINFGGIGWYRKHFTLPTSGSSQQQAFLEFEGVFLHCWIYVNGVLVGEHKGGYTTFSYDITKQAIGGGADNVLAVKVSSNQDNTIAPLAGDHIFTGGIYRDVYLVTTDPMHVQFNGMYVSTPFAGSPTSSAGYTLPTSYTKVPIRVKFEIKNKYNVMRSCYVRTEIFDADSQSVLVFPVLFQDIDSGAVDTVIQEDSLESPRFWSPSDAYLYRASTQIWIGCDCVDQYETDFGIRWFQSTATDGFYLNGKKIYLRGFNVHQDHAGWATAVTNAGQVRDVKLCKETGAQFIRGSHYPKDPAFVKACDTLGMCLMMEMCYWGKGGGTGANASPVSGTSEFTAFKQNCLDQTTEMVRAFRNNPSIMFWSLANEPAGGVLNCNDLNAAVKALDSTRPTCVVTNFVENNLHGSEDIIGQNGTAPTQGTKPGLWTELWETEEASRPGNYSAGADNEAAFRLGTARWAAFDYGTHEDWMASQGKPLNMTGMCDNYRIPKRRYYYLRNQWLGTAPPTWPQAGTSAKLSLTADKTTILNNGTDDCQLLVTVLDAQNNHISNNVNVTLKKISGNGMFPTGDTIQLATVDGLAAIEFRSYQPGKTTITASSGSIASAELSIVVIDESLTPINQFFDSNKAGFGPGFLYLKSGGVSGNTLKIIYNITGEFSLLKKPALELYSLQGRLIQRINLKERSGAVLFKRSGNGAASAGLYICKLRYDNRAAVIKNILVH